MKVRDYEYDLPTEAIALYPPSKRGTSRLLVMRRKTGKLLDERYEQLPSILHAGDLVIINNTRVLPARLSARTESGARRELLLLEKHGAINDPKRGKVMYRGRLQTGQRLQIGDTSLEVTKLYGDGTAVIEAELPLTDISERFGSVPLPPYMRRGEEKGDRERYQTVFARDSGSVAAPTASLNLTQQTLAKMKDRGIEVAELTLHVGLGTFMPIRVDDVTNHRMHREFFNISASTCASIRRAKEQGRRVVAIGTTVTRTLEYAVEDILEGGTDVSGEADIFIYPGYKFAMIDAMLTNFHAPHSTVLMMAAAFAGWENLRTAYQHALDREYKFLSYGDSMLIV